MTLWLVASVAGLFGYVCGRLDGWLGRHADKRPARPGRRTAGKV